MSSAAMKPLGKTDAKTATTISACDEFNEIFLRITPGQPLMRDSDVLAVQTQRLAKGYAPGKLDGVYGNITGAAVLTLQTGCGIKADGIVGPEPRVFLR